MFDRFKYMEHPLVERSMRISSTAVVRSVLRELVRKYGKPGDKDNMNIINEVQAEEIKNILNNEFPDYDALIVPRANAAMEFDYVPSNLGNGYIFYFICSCSRRVLHLYEFDEQLMCRTCHRLRYKKRQTTKEQRLRKLLRNPAILANYLASTPKHYEIAAEALELLKQELVRQ